MATHSLSGYYITLYHTLPNNQPISSTTSKTHQTRPTKSASTAAHSSTTNSTTTTTFLSTASLTSKMNYTKPPKTTNVPTNMIEDYVFEFHVQTNQEEQINNTTHLEEESIIKQEESYNAAEQFYIFISIYLISGICIVTTLQLIFYNKCKMPYQRVPHSPVFDSTLNLESVV